jgi:phosphatidylglycerophosphatase A
MRTARLIASAGGIGFAPLAPGTAGSLAALLPGAALMLLPGYALPAAIGVVLIAGLWSIAASGARDDPGWVVIDEVAGQWIALLGLAHLSIVGLAAAFALFRLFDIVKPGPVAWADRQHGALGVMADDAIAGTIAAVLLLAITRLWPSLLV